MKFNNKNFFIAIFFIALVLSSILQPVYAIEDMKDVEISGELIVRFKPKALKNKETMSAIHNKIGARVKKEFKIVSGMNLIKLGGKTSLKEAINYYEKNPNVLYAEPNYKRKILNNKNFLDSENHIKSDEQKNEDDERFYKAKKELSDSNTKNSNDTKVANEKNEVKIETVIENIRKYNTKSQDTLATFYESEPNNSISQANYVDSNYYGKPPYGIIGTITDYYFDMDYYKFNITKCGTIDLTGFWLGNYYEFGWEDDLLVGLYDSDGNLLKAANLYGYGSNTYRHLEKELEAGTYYILVLANNEFGSLYVNEHYGVSVSFEPNFEYDFDYLWGLKNRGQMIQGNDGLLGADISATNAWKKEEGVHNTIIAVVDTGVDYNHLFLNDNMWQNRFGINGYDFVNNDNYPMDDVGHGTHVAGIIAGYDANRFGEEQPVGVMKDASIMSLKAVDQDGYIDVASFVEALEYATENNADVINLSIGGAYYSIAEYDAIKNSNAVIVASAGNYNSNNDYTPVYPANYDLTNIISVAATDNNDLLAEFSNYGGSTIDVAAPGKDIFSLSMNGGYVFNTGTSMSAAYVSGIAGLILSYNNELNNEEVIDIIKESVDKKAKLSSKIITGGRVNAEKALNLADGYISEIGITKVVISIEGNNVILDISDYEEAFLEGKGNELYDYLYGESGIVINSLGTEDKFMDVTKYAIKFALNEKEAIINTPAISEDITKDYKILGEFDSQGDPIFNQQ